ncbi:MAG: ATP-dependent helicase, partial [Alphaproteobacteria bacterium]|nr:ATP-dependent helicase [Alphaproteobacteria bacterium]
ELKPKPRKSLTELVQNFERWRSLLDGLPHTELAETVLEESGYTAMLQADKSAEAPGRLENLKELINALQEFENLAGFLEHVSLVMENTESRDADMVNIMTLHAAKGLEFDTVFLPGWEEGVFPNQRALDETGVAGLEEERRLAYVGLTRARKRAFVSFAANRRIYNQWQASIPSRFVAELPPEHLEQRSDAGLYGSYSAGHYGSLRETATAASGDSDWGWTPGQRLQRKRSPLIEGEITARDAEDVDYEIGQRIFHQKFGYGAIAAIDGNKLDIEFEKAGRKKVLASFVSAA